MRRSLFALTMIAGTLLPEAATAQMMRAGVGSVRLDIAARMTVPTRLLVRRAGVAEPVRREGSLYEVALPVESAANIEWTLALRAGDGQPRGVVSVLAADGRWVPLGAEPIEVLRGAPTNPRVHRIRVRLSDPGDLAWIERSHVLLQPRIGAP